MCRQQLLFVMFCYGLECCSEIQMSYILSNEKLEGERESSVQYQMPTCCGWWSEEFPLCFGALGSCVNGCDTSLTCNSAQTQFVHNICSLLHLSVWSGPSTAIGAGRVKNRALPETNMSVAELLMDMNYLQIVF